jgi:hypothetical protein
MHIVVYHQKHTTDHHAVPIVGAATQFKCVLLGWGTWFLQQQSRELPSTDFFLMILLMMELKKSGAEAVVLLGTGYVPMCGLIFGALVV